MRADFNEPEPLPEEIRYPGTVYAAGVIWIGFGCLILLNAATHLVLAVGDALAGVRNAQIGGAGMVVIMGALFIHVGVQSTRGTARNTLGNSIGSLVFALFLGAVGLLAFLRGLAAGGDPRAVVALIVDVLYLLGAGGLLTAGVLALVGRDAYRAWQRAQQDRMARRGAGDAGVIPPGPTPPAP
jgi:hypothetical protein